MRAAFDFAFNDIGGEAGFADWARRNRSDFYRLYAKLLPTHHTGSPLVAINIGDQITVTDPIEASRTYEQIMAGTLTPDAVRFDPAPVAAISHEAASRATSDDRPDAVVATQSARPEAPEEARIAPRDDADLRETWERLAR